jgi:phosphate:Na+ symporter
VGEFMDFFEVLSLFGGLALFLYGMNLMGEALAKTAGGGLETALEKLTKTRIKGVLLGAAVTAVIQSSSATTVMVVGFVNSGIMKLGQAVGIIMGANIGTTITSWLLSLSGIESSNFWIKLLKPSSFSPILAVVGIIFLLFTRSRKRHDTGEILIGFAILMFGMDTMSSAVKPLASVPGFTGILTRFSNPILGIAAGAVITAVIQSSSASVGILQALCITGSVSYSMAIPIILGQNIGTCITALISGIGARKNAKRAAFVHLYFNLAGALIFIILFFIVKGLFPFGFLSTPANAAGIAVVHTVFNIGAAAFLLPFAGFLERLAMSTVKAGEADISSSDKAYDFEYLDERFLERPAFAVARSVSAIKSLLGLTEEMLLSALYMLSEPRTSEKNEIYRKSDAIKKRCEELGIYMAKATGSDLNRSDSMRLSVCIYSLANIRGLSVQAENIGAIAVKLKKYKGDFPDKLKSGMKEYANILRSISSCAADAFINDDLEMAHRVKDYENIISSLSEEIKKYHLSKLQKGKYGAGAGAELEKLINSYERITEHSAQMAESVIRYMDKGKVKSLAEV